MDDYYVEEDEMTAQSFREDYYTRGVFLRSYPLHWGGVEENRDNETVRRKTAEIRVLEKRSRALVRERSGLRNLAGEIVVTEIKAHRHRKISDGRRNLAGEVIIR
ncbi:hypothetical protein RJ641_012898 [Dillenia turbinata]|uniref:Uncharacterized protein n=1 Tax=Dillenia turbinata TaxID=194707 RepID=A0AAN8V315_9MAGN